MTLFANQMHTTPLSVAAEAFQAQPLEQPIRYVDVQEGHYAIAAYDEAATHIATCALFVCKAVIIYDPSVQRGLLAHIDGTTNVQKLLEPVIERFNPHLRDAHVSIVQATQDDDTRLWPTTDHIAAVVAAYEPKLIRVEHNTSQRRVRSISLNLLTGGVQEIDHESDVYNASHPVHIQSQPLRNRHRLPSRPY